MILKVEIFLAICAFQGVCGQSAQEVQYEYNPQIMKVIESQINKYDSLFRTFKANLSEQFSETIDTIAGNMFEFETNVTSAKNKIDSDSEIASDCLVAFSQAINDISVDLNQCYPYGNLINVAKKLRILKTFPAKIFSTIADCQKIYKKEEQDVELEGCLESKFQEDEVAFDSLTRSIASNLDEAEVHSTVCLKMTEISNLFSCLGTFVDLFSCLKSPKPDLDLKEELDSDADHVSAPNSASESSSQTAVESKLESISNSALKPDQESVFDPKPLLEPDQRLD